MSGHMILPSHLLVKIPVLEWQRTIHGCFPSLRSIIISTTSFFYGYGPSLAVHPAPAHATQVPGRPMLQSRTGARLDSSQFLYPAPAHWLPCAEPSWQQVAPKAWKLNYSVPRCFSELLIGTHYLAWAVLGLGGCSGLWTWLLAPMLLSFPPDLVAVIAWTSPLPHSLIWCVHSNQT